MTVSLYLGDCLNFMRTMPAGSADAVITDPPYGINIAANPFRQKFEKSDWDGLPASSESISELRRVSIHQIIWGGNYFNLPPTRCFLIWDKVQPEDFSSAMVEMAWSNFDRSAKLFRRHVVSYEKFHPTTKPIELMRWCIENYTNPSDTIFDPFMGSGTTGVACVQLGRNFIGCEIDPKYFEIAKKRIAQAEMQPQLFTEKKPVEKQADLI
jgi:site-specific DNA-methyltransferase (adenine-specific)